MVYDPPVSWAAAFRSHLNPGEQANVIRAAWNVLAGLPGGRRIFSKAVGRAAPYTGSISAQVEEVRVNYARVHMDDQPRLRNHLHSVHAVALVNLAELTGNLAVAYSMPDDARFIVAGLSIEYLKKARGRILGETRTPAIESNERKEYEIPVELKDSDGDIVAKAILRTLVGPKRR